MIEQAQPNHVPIESLDDRIEIGEALLHELIGAIQADPLAKRAYDDALKTYRESNPGIGQNLHVLFQTTAGVHLIGRFYISNSLNYPSSRISLHEAQSPDHKNVGISVDEGDLGISRLSFKSGNLKDSNEAAEEFKRTLNYFFGPTPTTI